MYALVRCVPPHEDVETNCECKPAPILHWQPRRMHHAAQRAGLALSALSALRVQVRLSFLCHGVTRQRDHRLPKMTREMSIRKKGAGKEFSNSKKKKLSWLRGGPSTYWPTLGRESWTGNPWGGVGRGFGSVPGYTTLSVRVQANT